MIIETGNEREKLADDQTPLKGLGARKAVHSHREFHPTCQIPHGKVRKVDNRAG